MTNATKKPTAEQIKRAQYVVANEDYLPWAEVKAAKELLGIEEPDVVAEFLAK